jgi:hypothetical protein
MQAQAHGQDWRALHDGKALTIETGCLYTANPVNACLYSAPLRSHETIAVLRQSWPVKPLAMPQ